MTSRPLSLGLSDRPPDGGGTGARIEAFDWSGTALGPRSAWPAHRRIAVGLMLQSAAPMATIWGPSGIVLYNDAYAALAGDRHPALLGAPLLEGWPEAADANRRGLDAALRRESITLADQSLVRHDHGRPRQLWCTLSYSALLDEAGAVAGVLCVAFDTTLAVETINRLRASEAQARTALALRPQIAWFADPSGSMVECDARWADLTGLERQAAIRSGLVEVSHFGDQRNVAVAWADSIRTGKDYDVDHRVRTAEGSYLWMRSRASAARDDQRRILGWHGTSEPTGPRKILELRQALLLTLGDRFRASSGPSEIVAAAAEAIGLELGVRRVDYGEMDAAQDSASFATFWTDGRYASRAGPMRLAHIAPGSSEALGAGHTVVTEVTDAAGLRLSGILVPLASEGRLRALLLVENDGGHAWPGEDVALVEDVAARAWDALEQARSASVLRRNQARQGFLLVLGDRLRELDDPDEIMETVEESLGRHLRLSKVAYGEVMPGEELAFTRGWSDGSVTPIVGLFPLHSLGRHNVADLSHGLTTSFETGSGEEELPQPSIFAELRSGIAVPLIREGKLRGALILGHALDHRWSADEVALAGEVAARLWEALERARAEAALHDLNATLENRVAQRTLELTSSETRFRTLFETAPAPIFLIRVGPGRRAVFDAVNAATERFLGTRAAAMLGQSVSRAASNGDLLLASCIECASNGLPIEFEINVGGEGEMRTAECLLAPLPIEDDETQLLIGIARDITAQRNAEDQLRQAQKMEAIGQLTGGIAHDFNNLLTGIIGSLSLIEKRLGQGKIDVVERYVGLAKTSANRAAALTHRLLAFSRRQPLEARSVDVNELVTSMDELLRRTLGESVALETIVSQDLWLTLCDPHQLENALLNLAINGRDAMPDGGRLTIETGNAVLDDPASAREAGVDPGEYVALSVTDTGMGMPPDVIARAFDPFFTTKPIGQGTGLGLSMIYGFAKQSEGHVKIASEVAQGTTVTIFLPRHMGLGEAASQPPSGDVPRAEAGETVLVVEDDATVRGLVLDVLQELGYTAIEAGDGASGLRILQSNRRIDLLVTDVGLPGMNGRQLAEQGRARRPELRILFITGYAENAAFGIGHLDGDMQMMTKPFAVDELATRIRDILGQG